MDQTLDLLARCAARADELFSSMRPSAEVTWRWVEVAASELREASESGDEAASRRAVVSLLALVGNFKRQAPIDLGDPPDVAAASEWRHAGVRLIGLRPEVSVDASPASIKPLIQVAGLRTATASALLAALFPDSHVIMDARTTPRAAALSCAIEGRSPLFGDDEAAEVHSSAYAAWYQPLLFELAGAIDQPIRSVERVLFLLDMPNSGYGAWENMGQVLLGALRQLIPK